MRKVLEKEMRDFKSSTDDPDNIYPVTLNIGSRSISIVFINVVP